MADTDYPKIKYQGVVVPPGTDHNSNPGYIYRKVANPEEEHALGGDWHDTPTGAIDAFRRRETPPAGDGGVAAGKNLPGAHAEGGERKRQTEEWPTETEKRKR